MFRSNVLLFALSLSVASLAATPHASAQVPAAIAAPAEATVVTLHAEGAQIYECKPNNQKKLGVDVSRADRHASARR